MKTGTMGSGRFGRFAVVLGALSLGLLATGCGEECVDQFDCVRERGTPAEGKRYVCEANRCVVRDLADAGTGGTDAGSDAGTDAGTDAGVACADLPHDPKLGTLQLQTGYAATESVALPDGIGAVTAVQGGSEFKLYGLHGADNSLYNLGTWPTIASSTTPLQAVIPEDDRGSSTFPGGYLTNDGTRLLTGYTMAGAGFPGKVLVYDSATPGNTVYLSAPGNYTAVGVSGGFLINGTGLEGVAEGGAAVYALKTDARPFSGFKLATFPVANPASGYTALASNNVAVLGYSDTDQGYANFLRAVAPATYTPAFSGGTTLALSDANAPSIYASSEHPEASLAEIDGFGEGVAIRRSVYDSSFNEFTHDVSRISLTVGGITPGTVTAGDFSPVLTTSNRCTSVVLMAPMGADLLVGVKDKNGRRIVRLQLPQ
ncbi:hypothetical protein [Archangium lansingense]|uniref:Lipoprotein n=1 Tax=Archangium lansingense TaxID=2995310 RepID=A0ABT4AK57_9BACT|nr:hypothetical protein [Archangium lansinium]MCY1082058.1 hypothetical protein [Archangium lansinium]